MTRRLDPLGLITDQDLWQAVEAEVAKADERYGPFASTHEGLGVLMEEVDELKQTIRENRLEETRREALQVAAVAYRLAASTFDPDCRKRSQP